MQPSPPLPSRVRASRGDFPVTCRTPLYRFSPPSLSLQPHLQSSCTKELELASKAFGLSPTADVSSIKVRRSLLPLQRHVSVGRRSYRSADLFNTLGGSNGSFHDIFCAYRVHGWEVPELQTRLAK